MIELCGVTKEFHGNTIVEDVSLKFEEGMIYGITGRNGSGKTILLKMIMGLVRPTKGEVFIDGKPLRAGFFAEDTGVVCDSIGFLPQLSAMENLYSLARIQKKIGIPEIRRILERMGLDADSKKVYRKFSLGMKQKLAIAQAFMEQPRILLLDEPMNGLDEESVEDMREFFKEYVKKHNAVMVLTSHNREDIGELCSCTYQIGKGGRLCLESPEN